MAGRVLLLERDSLTRDLLEELLTSEGHDVRVCRSLGEVSATAVRDPGGVALVDTPSSRYETLSGPEAGELTRLAQTIPTIVLTAGSWPTMSMADELGALALIEKPFDIAELSALVDHWVEQLRSDSTAARAEARRLRAAHQAARSWLRQARQRLLDAQGR